MNTTTQGISPLRRRMIEEMQMRQLAPKTREAYIRAVLHFTRYLRRSPDTATAEELRSYQVHCVKQGISAITLNSTITGLKFFFEATLGQKEVMARMHPVRVRRTLPTGLRIGAGVGSILNPSGRWREAALRQPTRWSA